MEKESLQSAENLEVADVLSEKKQRRNLGLLIMIKISLMRLQRSLVYLRNMSGKCRIISEERIICICICRT